MEAVLDLSNLSLPDRRLMQSINACKQRVAASVRLEAADLNAASPPAIKIAKSPARIYRPSSTLSK